jgi:hypothetical protein
MDKEPKTCRCGSGLCQFCGGCIKVKCECAPLVRVLGSVSISSRTPQDDDKDHETGITIRDINLAVTEYVRRQTLPITERIMELQQKLQLAGDPHTEMKISDQIQDLKKKIAGLPNGCQIMLQSAASRKEQLQLLNR